MLRGTMGARITQGAHLKKNNEVKIRDSIN